MRGFIIKSRSTIYREYKVVAMLVPTAAAVVLINLYLFAENVLAEYNETESGSRMSRIILIFF